MMTDQTVYVVEDDPEMRQSVCHVLASVSVPVETYADAEEFLEGEEPPGAPGHDSRHRREDEQAHRRGARSLREDGRDSSRARHGQDEGGEPCGAGPLCRRPGAVGQLIFVFSSPMLAVAWRQSGRLGAVWRGGGGARGGGGPPGAGPTRGRRASRRVCAGGGWPR